MHDYIIGIDPGTTESAFCLMEALTYKPLFFRKEKNKAMWLDVFEAAQLVDWNVDFVIEKMKSYGNPVGDDVLDTCIWIGQMKDRIEGTGKDCHFVFRMEEKMNLCHNPRAGDSMIRHALIDRFAKGVPNLGKGSKKEPGWFYGFKADVWQAYAIAVTYRDKYWR